jgi:hypothetical protein
MEMTSSANAAATTTATVTFVRTCIAREISDAP